MNIERTRVRNILLAVVVACAFIIDARTARATTLQCFASPSVLPHDGACFHGDALSQPRASDAGLQLDRADRWRSARPSRL